MMDMASIVMDTFIGIGILLLIVKAVTKKDYRHIPSHELGSSEVTHLFRRIQRP